jgi:hypothetical protein
MPAEQRMDPTVLNAVAGVLKRSGTAALDASHELLAHYTDTGDGPTQRAVDTLIDHAADALRALTDSFADLSVELVAAASAAAAPATLEAARRRHPAAGGSSARSRPRRER